MTKDKIIANIESYMNFADEEHKKYYEFALSQSAKEGKPIKELFKNILCPSLYLAEIVQELKQEIKTEELKKSKGNSYVKRSALINKIIAQNHEESGWNKGWFEEINGEKMQCCTYGGFYAFAFRNTVDIPMHEFAPATTIAKAIPAIYRGWRSADFDIAEIKTQLRLYKGAKSHCTVNVGKKFYTAQYFINVFEGLGGNVTMYQNPNVLSPDVFESENGIAILCPVRKEEDN